MHFLIQHTIRYKYCRAVFLEPHDIRLRPRTCGTQVLRAFDIQVDPAPIGISHYLDAEGNQVTSTWFDGSHDSLTVTSHTMLETRRANPFDYLLRREWTALPLTYDARTEPLLRPAMTRVEAPAGGDAVADFAAERIAASEARLLPFLDELNQTLYQQWECLHREEGDPWLPSYTLQQRRGACRDLAELFVDVCRSVGIAARFVSGYQAGDKEQDRRELHAWAEVYVPGGGWRGYDPTHGLAVADDHVPLAASARAAQAAPIIGSFRGTDVTSTMETNVLLQYDEQLAQIQQAQQQQQ